MPQTGWGAVCKKTEMYFFTVPQAGCPRSKWQPVWFHLSPWLADGPFLSVSSHGLYLGHMSLLVSLLLHVRTLVLMVGPTLMTSFNTNYSFKGLISKYNHIGGYWFSIWIWGGGHTSVHNTTSLFFMGWDGATVFLPLQRFGRNCYQLFHFFQMFFCVKKGKKQGGHFKVNGSW